MTTAIIPRIIRGCGTTDKLHQSGFGIKPELDKLNMLAFYNGHTHTYLNVTLDGRLYVSEDALTSSDRGSCDDGVSEYVGYTFINKTKRTLSYTRLKYSEQFVDVFN